MILFIIRTFFRNVVLMKLEDIDQDGNYLDQLYKDENNNFLGNSIIEETDSIVHELVTRNIYYNDIRKIFQPYKPPENWLVRYYEHEVYWDIYWNLFMLRLAELYNGKLLLNTNLSSSIIKKIKNLNQKQIIDLKTSSNIVNDIIYKLLIGLLSIPASAMLIITKIILLFPFKKKINNKIAIEYVWGHNTKNISDLYWFEGSEIEPSKLIFYFNRSDRPITNEIKNDLYKLGINKTVNLYKRKIHFLLFKTKIIDKVEIINSLCRVFICLFQRPLNSHLLSNKIFTMKTFKLVIMYLYWRILFRNNNIKINMSHSGDTGSFHVIQSLAIDSLDGINVRGTYSYPSIFYRAYSREFHVYFLWSRNLGSIRLNKFNNKYNVISGYPFDRLFKKVKKEKHSKSYEKENAISVFDTTVTPEYITYFYTKLFEFSKKNNVKLHIKPKKIKKTDLMQIENFDICNDKNLISIYSKEVIPSSIIKKSKIAVCLGINSAGIEVALNNGYCVYWIPDNFYCEQLISVKKSKLIYHSFDNLIYDINQFLFCNDISIGDHSEILDQIDFWRDGNGGKRVGLYLKNYLSALNNDGRSLARIKNANKIYVNNWGKETIIQSDNFKS